MALWTMATDLNTRQTIWVSRNVVKDRPQLNSHREDDFGRAMARGGIDGYPATEVAAFHTTYAGNQK